MVRSNVMATVSIATGGMSHREVRIGMIQIDMKMPSSCYDCPFVKNERTNDYGSFCECGILEDHETINLLEHSKHLNCPLIEQEPILDKIRDEFISLYPKNYAGEPELGGSSCEFSLNKVLKVIDKYKAERSEG